MSYKITVRAGIGRENPQPGDDVFRYVVSPIPPRFKSVDDSEYKAATGAALEAAKRLVQATGEAVTLELIVKVKPKQLSLF